MTTQASATAPLPSRLIDWARPYRGRLAIGAVALLATNALGFAVPKLLKRAIDSLSSGVDRSFLGHISLAIFTLATVQAGVRIASRLLIFNAARDIEQDLRQRLFDHLLAWAPETLQRHSLGDLQSRMLNDLTNVRLMFGVGLLSIVNAGVSYSMALPLMLSENPKLALVALAPYPVMIAIMSLLARRIFRYGVTAGQRLSDVSTLINEDLGARLFITGQDLGPTQARRFAEQNDAYIEANLALVRTRAMMFPVMGGLSSLGMVLALYTGGRMAMAGEITVGALVAFTAYLAMLSFPTIMLGFMVAMFQRGRASWSRIAELLAVEPWRSPSRDLTQAPRELELRDLHLRRGDKSVLHIARLRVQAGERIGIVGEIGSGKSTLLSVLARLAVVPPDSYTLDGVSATELSLASLRRHIGYVPQQPFLFSMTVRDNLRLGARVGDEALLEACAVAAVRHDIDKLPQGLDTEIGERGVALSGGQKQRLALARALLKRPAVLLLDDSFSAVDADTEETIIQRLNAALRGQTWIIATHRLAVLEHVDRVIVLDKGHIIEDGPPAALLGQPGSRYADLYRKQRLAESLVGT